MSISVPCTWSGCGSTFTRPYSLRRHVEETHSTANRVTCEECYQTFSRLEFLKRHMRSHHGNANENCGICSRSYRADYLAIHQKVCKRKKRSQCTQPKEPGRETMAPGAGIADTEINLPHAVDVQREHILPKDLEDVHMHHVQSEHPTQLGYESAPSQTSACMQAKAPELSSTDMTEGLLQQSTSWTSNHASDYWLTITEGWSDLCLNTIEMPQPELLQSELGDGSVTGLESMSVGGDFLHQSSLPLTNIGPGHGNEPNFLLTHDLWAESIMQPSTLFRPSPTVSSPKEAQTSTFQGPQWQCSECGELFGKSYMLDAHTKNTKHRAWACCDCRKTYVRISTLSRHRRTVHVDKETYCCGLCGDDKAFRRMDHLRQHLREVHRHCF